jgi:hypothetical protein
LPTVQSNDNNHQALDFPPVPVPAEPAKAPRFAALREWWNDAWDEDGVLYELWEDVRTAPEVGWHGMAPWIKALLAVAGLSFVVLILQAAGAVVLDALHQLLTAAPKVQVATDISTGVWAVIDQPVRTYIAQHSAGLAVSASTVYTLWQSTGIGALVLGFLSRNNGVRLTWTAWGAATVWMVWTNALNCIRYNIEFVAAWQLRVPTSRRRWTMSMRVFPTRRCLRSFSAAIRF